MKKLVAACAAAITIFSAQGQAQTISKDEYRDKVLVLFEEFLQMKTDGVFLDQATIKALGRNYKFPNAIRGNNPPGGWFARPPGSDWVKRVEALDDTGHKFVCFDIPALPSESGVCGFDLVSLHTGILDQGAVSFLDALAAKFWLATICHRTPAACERYIDD